MSDKLQFVVCSRRKLATNFSLSDLAPA